MNERDGRSLWSIYLRKLRKAFVCSETNFNVDIENFRQSVPLPNSLNSLKKIS